MGMVDVPRTLHTREYPRAVEAVCAICSPAYSARYAAPEGSEDEPVESRAPGHLKVCRLYDGSRSRSSADWKYGGSSRLLFRSLRHRHRAMSASDKRAVATELGPDLAALRLLTRTHSHASHAPLTLDEEREE